MLFDLQKVCKKNTIYDIKKGARRVILAGSQAVLCTYV